MQAPIVIGLATALTPATAASRAPLPLSRSAAMLSPTTKASSTTRPIIRKNAIIVPRFNVRLAGSKKTRVAMKENGIPRVIHSAARRSNTSTSSTRTSTAPITPFRRIPDSLARAGSAGSFQTVTDTPSNGS